MPSIPTTGSPNIQQLDIKVAGSLCSGKFTIDVTPSSFIGTGASNVLGAKVKIVNNVGSVVRDYGISYDILPPMTGSVQIDIPKFSNTFRAGTYTIFVKLFDTGGRTYEVSKPIKICALDKDKPYKAIDGQMYSKCSEGKVTFVLNNIPTYNGELPSDETISLNLNFPTGSGKAPKTGITVGTFSVEGFEGLYTVKGDICANYSFDDNVSVEVPYRLNFEKSVRCNLNKCAVLESLTQLHKVAEEGCSEADRVSLYNTSLDAIRLLTMAEMAIECGQDATSYIEELESLLGCQGGCSFGGNEGEPFGVNLPAEDFVIQGCNIESSVDGLTTTYTINNYEYRTKIEDNGGILTISTPQLAGCIKTQTIHFDIEKVYQKMKEFAIRNDDEIAFWGGGRRVAWNAVNVSCLGITPQAWSNMTETQQLQAIINAVCAGVECSSVISSLTLSKQGLNVVAAFSSTGASKIEVYLDGVKVGEAAGNATSYTFNNAADGLNHTVRLLPVCSNGLLGVAEEEDFNFAGCPVIQTTVMNGQSSNGVQCPFDLNTLLGAVPAGLSVEWHTANNTSGATLISNPASVAEGDYWVFNRDANGCYSTGTKVTVICNTQVACTAPINLSVGLRQGGGFLVSFNGAINPPPNNAYIVKRRLSSQPNVPASYTTIGTPVLNSTTGKFEIADPSAQNNTYYVYVAESICSGDFRPSSSFNFVNFTCPTAVLTKTNNSASYSFSPVGGSVDKITVELYDDLLVNKVSEVVYTAPFPNPIAGTFPVTLQPNTKYSFRTVLNIGNFTNYCSWQTVQTNSGGGVPPSTGIYPIGQTLAIVCGGETTMQIYWAAGATIGEGVAIYTNSALTSPLDGSITRIKIGATVYAVTNSVIGAATGESCSSGLGGCIAMNYDYGVFDGSIVCNGELQAQQTKQLLLTHIHNGDITPAPQQIIVRVFFTYTNYTGGEISEFVDVIIPSGQSTKMYSWISSTYVYDGEGCSLETREPTGVWQIMTQGFLQCE